MQPIQCEDITVRCLHWDNQVEYRTLYLNSSSVIYRKVPKYLDAQKLCCNLPKIQTMRPNLSNFPKKDANGIANSEDSRVRQQQVIANGLATD